MNPEEPDPKPAVPAYQEIMNLEDPTGQPARAPEALLVSLGSRHEGRMSAKPGTNDSARSPATTGERANRELLLAELETHGSNARQQVETPAKRGGFDRRMKALKAAPFPVRATRNDRAPRGAPSKGDTISSD